MAMNPVEQAIETITLDPVVVCVSSARHGFDPPIAEVKKG
jgi:hypothetical protein